MRAKYVLIDKTPLCVGSFMPRNAYSGDGVCLLREGCMMTSQAQLLRLALPDVQFGEYVPQEKSDDESDAQKTQVDENFAPQIAEDCGELVRIPKAAEVSLHIEHAAEVKAAHCEERDIHLREAAYRRGCGRSGGAGCRLSTFGRDV